MRWETNPLKGKRALTYKWFRKPSRKKFAWVPTVVGHRKIWLESYVVKNSVDLDKFFKERMRPEEWNDPFKRNTLVVNYLRSAHLMDETLRITKYLPEDLL